MNYISPLDIGVIMGLIMAWSVVSLAFSFRLLRFPDLTIEGSFPLGAAVFAEQLKTGRPLALAIIAGCLSGALSGVLTAVLHTRFRLNKFLAGIIVVAICYSVSLRIMSASNIGLLDLPSVFSGLEVVDSRMDLSIHAAKMFALSALALAGCVLILRFLYTKSGTQMRAVGSNTDFARSLGLNVTLKLALGLAFTNSLAALSGILLSQHQGFADVGMGQGVLIMALAALTVGERLMPSRRLAYPTYVLLAGLVGSVIYQVLVSYASAAGLAPSDLKLATALLVLLVVAVKMSRNGDVIGEQTA